MEAAAAAVRLLSRTAEAALVNNECCGLLFLARVHVGEYRELLQENIKLYEDYDIIVADCACSADTLKKPRNKAKASSRLFISANCSDKVD